MLEQAIIDAEALKEAATKNAETLVLEKYSDQIRGAVESLLEQEDPLAAAPAGAAPMEDPAAADPMAAAPEPAPAGGDTLSSVMEHIPLAVTGDLDEEVEIPLDKLMEEVQKLSETMRFGGAEIFDEDLYEDLDEELYEYGAFDENLYEDLDEDLDEELIDEELDEELYMQEDLLDEAIFDDEKLEEDRTATSTWAPTQKPPVAGQQIDEKLEVDVGNNLVPRGFAGLPESVYHLAEEELLAMEQDSKVREEQEAKRKAVRELNAVNETLARQNEKLTKTLNKSAKFMNKLRNAVLVLEEKLEKSNLDNAKLLYQNKALNSDSLNERQKQTLVEAVSNADTIEEAKVIFETLQNTVGSTSRKSQPNSLSEAVQKSSSVILSARKENSSKQNNNDPTLNRWKFLAGIDKQ
jgi:hypothetical protein